MNELIERKNLPPAKKNIDNILVLENEVKKLEQIKCPLQHYFAPGVYVREITMPKGAVITGAIHKYTHMNIVSTGIVTFTDEHGVRKIDASERPVTFMSNAGSKKALYIHEDTVWTTIHPTDETDIDKLEKDITVDNYEDLKLCLSS